jgi:hypothetical protein
MRRERLFGSGRGKLFESKQEAHLKQGGNVNGSKEESLFEGEGKKLFGSGGG